MVTFGDWVTSELHKRGYDDNRIREGEDALIAQGRLRKKYLGWLIPGDEEKHLAMVDTVLFVPRHNIWVMGVDCDSKGRADLADDLHQLKWSAITTDKYGLEPYDPSNVEIFDPNCEADKAREANSWVKDADLRQKLIEAAYDNVPHFKRPDLIA